MQLDYESEYEPKLKDEFKLDFLTVIRDQESNVESQLVMTEIISDLRKYYELKKMIR